VIPKFFTIGQVAELPAAALGQQARDYSGFRLEPFGPAALPHISFLFECGCKRRSGERTVVWRSCF
jgi:hypothetical protein